MGMSASQGRLLFMTARLSNNEFEQQCVAYSKQRLADSSQKVNDEYLEALKATSYQILTGYNGTDATYADVTYNQLTGYFGDSNISTSLFDSSTQNTGVAANKQYIIKDNKGQILVTAAIANAFKESQGDYNKFLLLMGQKDGYINGYTQVSSQNISQQDVHEAWDKYFVAIGRGANASNSMHILGFAYNNEAAEKTNQNGEKVASEEPDVDFATYTSKYITSAMSREKIYLNIDKTSDSDITPTYYVQNYEIIGVPYTDSDGNIAYRPAYQKEALHNQETYIYLEDFGEESGLTYNTNSGTYVNADNEPVYINPITNIVTTDYRTNIDDNTAQAANIEEEIIFYEGTTKEQRELYDYAMAVSKQYAADPAQKMTYDAGRLTYYQNIYNQMITGGYTTYTEMLDTNYMKANETNEKVAYQNENWLVTQLKNGKLNIAYYSALEKDFVATTLDDDESICEKEDKSKIAIAEVEYNNKMDKLEAEDKQFDLTLNKLEAEHSALQTEYDAVVKVISKNVEKSFSIFNA